MHECMHAYIYICKGHTYVHRNIDARIQTDMQPSTDLHVDSPHGWDCMLTETLDSARGSSTSEVGTCKVQDKQASKCMKVLCLQET